MFGKVWVLIFAAFISQIKLETMARQTGLPGIEGLVGEYRFHKSKDGLNFEALVFVLSSELLPFPKPDSPPHG